MNTWGEISNAAPELAAQAERRLKGRVSYLATVQKDGAPRVHPVTPIIGGGQLFIFMEPTSPKGNDLRRDGRYALHCGVEDNDGGEGEVIVSGRATLVADPMVRAAAMSAATYAPKERYILFALEVESALATTYEGDKPVRIRWQG
jgi:nitroimidazol reductase NimA-like FMN-containing flavoprotein (pyridoxamine 5'-phosphate oxidase superfamily)